MATMNRQDAQNIIEKLRSFGISDTQLIDALIDNILPSGTAYSYAVDLAEEFDIDAVEDLDIEEDDEDEDEYEGEYMPFGY
jgi:hypothetical protein